MSINVQWANGFEDLSSLSLSVSGTVRDDYRSNLITGWEGESVGKANNIPITPYFSSKNNSEGYLRGSCASLNNFGNSNLVKMPRLKRSVVDDDLMCLSYAVKFDIASSSRQINIGIRSSSGDTVYASLGSGSFMSLKINSNAPIVGTLIDCLTGVPWVGIELFINKTLNQVQLRVAGVTECIGVLPAGFIAEFVDISVNGDITLGSLSPLSIDDIVFYTGSEPVGTIKVDGYFKSSDEVSGFSDGTDKGSANTTGINDSSFNGYRASSTSGQTDKFAYTNILPAGVEVTDIIAVIPSVIASSGTYSDAKLELIFESGTTLDPTDVSTEVKPFTPTLVRSKVYHNNPDTGMPWTRAEVQSIKTGYRVKS